MTIPVASAATQDNGTVSSKIAIISAPQPVERSDERVATGALCFRGGLRRIR
jgi:hypothetical protein